MAKMPKKNAYITVNVYEDAVHSIRLVAANTEMDALKVARVLDAESGDYFGLRMISQKAGCVTDSLLQVAKELEGDRNDN